jgi:hypothetical protein
MLRHRQRTERDDRLDIRTKPTLDVPAAASGLSGKP